ncbi:MAG: AMP-binding protein, partial [Clostridia bacterium]|nr:AMP-binding protein [Clostridia bacterium]
MKLGFSTKYWPGYRLRDFVALANESKFDAIEIHDIGFVTSHVEKIRKHFFTNGVEIAAINSNFNIAIKEDQESFYMTLAGLMKAAKRIHCPYIKVYAENNDENALDDVIDFLEKAIPVAEAAGITILIVTRDLFADTDKLATVLKHFACDNLAADWNMHDTYFVGGEDAETTIKNLGAYVKLVHVVDQTRDNEYALIGEGDLPMDEMINALRSVNYDGVICLEWNPKFLPEVDDLEVILIHYYHYMHSLIAGARQASHLYYNKTRTGKFLWKKETLIDKTFPQVLDAMVEEFPDQLAFKYTTLDYTRTYSEFRDDVDTFARSLLSLGVKKGTQVAVWATNVPEWYIAFWATTKIGAVLVTVNTAYKIAELEYLLRQSDTHTLIMIEGNKGNSYKATVEELCPELKETTKGKPLHAKRLPFLRNIITVGFEMDGALTFEEAVARAKEVPLAEVHRIAATVDKNDVANMQYTSGTTGFPKGVMLTHYNIVNNGKNIGDRMDLSTADRMMVQ